MGQNALTIVHSIDEAQRQPLEAALATLGDPAHLPCLGLQDLSGLHYLSAITVPELADQAPAYVVVELNVDGPADAFLERWIAEQPQVLEQIFGQCHGYPQAPGPQVLKDFLLRGSVAALTFHRGTPGRTVAQIHDERQLQQRVSTLAQPLYAETSSRPEFWQRLHCALSADEQALVASTPRLPLPVQWNLTDPAVRERLRALGGWLGKALLLLFGLSLGLYAFSVSTDWSRWLLPLAPLTTVLLALALTLWGMPRGLPVAAAMRVLGDQGMRALPGALQVTALVGLALWYVALAPATTAAAMTLLTSLALLTLLGLVGLIIGYLLGHWSGWISAALLLCIGAGVLWWRSASAGELLGNTLLLAGVFSALGIAALLWLAVQIRREEAQADVCEDELDLAHYEQVTARESTYVQNHLASVTRIKPGRVRLLVLRAVLRTIHLASVLFFNRGFLAGIPAIHFARFLILPDQQQLLFLANYDGTFNGYLGDFKDSAGATAIWSNTVGFPRSLFLLFEGAQDEERFKRYARNSQRQSLLWFSAYPDLRILEIDRASATRRDLQRSLEPGWTIRPDQQSWWQRVTAVFRPPLRESELARALDRLG